MAYTNAIFYIDLYGRGIGDGVRPTISGIVFSNPSGTIVKGTKVAHGLVTGAVITLSGCTQVYANSTWKITKLTDDTFTLDTALWISFTGVDVTGDAIPFGGASWSDAWTTISSGATTARIAPGDIIRISKTPDPISIGNATWTNLSSLITLASAQTKTVENCDSFWTVSTNVSLYLDPTCKQGTYANRFSIAAAFTTGKVAYKALPTALDLSSYQQLNFWFKTSVNILNNTTIRVCLCSDSVGNIVVDTFMLPIIYANDFTPFVLSRVGVGNLGAAINSIAIYADIDPGVPQIYIDNIFASTLSGINLQSLISKNTTDEAYFPIQSIDNSQIKIDGGNYPVTYINLGYVGTSQTIETFFRETFKTPIAIASLTQINTINAAGSVDNYIEYSGGWDIINTLQNGLTIYDGSNFWGCAFYCNSKTYIKVRGLIFIRYYNGIDLGGSMYWDIDVLQLYGNAYNQIVANSSSKCIIKVKTIGGGGYAINYSGNSRYNDFTFKNIICSSSGIYFTNCFNRNTFNDIENVCINSYGFQIASCTNIRIGVIKNMLYNTGGAFLLSSSFGTIIDKIVNLNNNGFGINFSSCFGCEVKEVTNANNNTSYVLTFYSSAYNKVMVKSSSGLYSYAISNSGKNFIHDSLFNQINIVNDNGYPEQYIYSLNHGGVVGDNRVLSSSAYAMWQTTIKHDIDIGSWKTVIIYPRDIYVPFLLKIAEIAFEANLKVTISGWCKKDHSTNITCRLVVKDNYSVGIVEIAAVKANDTNWEELSISFTPTKRGVTEVWLETWYIGGISNSYIGAISVIQD